MQPINWLILSYLTFFYLHAHEKIIDPTLLGIDNVSGTVLGVLHWSTPLILVTALRDEVYHPQLFTDEEMVVQRC